jgi:membrane protein
MTLHLDAGMLKETYTRWNADKAPRLAAALSYSTIFAIAPLLIIVIAVVGQVLGMTGQAHPHSQTENQLLGAIQRSAGPGAADAVRGMVTATFNKPHQGVIAQIVGWVTLALGASGLFAALQDSLNTVWHVEDQKRTIWQTIRAKAASLGMLLVIGFLLLVTTILSAALTFVSTYVTHLLPFPGAGFAFALVNWVVNVGVISLLFALIYKYLPDAKVEWRDVWTGALATAVLFVVGQQLIALYLGKAGVGSAYGAAGSLLVLLLWIYYSSMILLFGAEFTRVYAEKHGSLASQHAASDGDPKTRGATPSTTQGATVATGAGDAGAAQPGDAASGSQTAKGAPSVRGESDEPQRDAPRADAPAKPHPAGRPLT